MKKFSFPPKTSTGAAILAVFGLLPVFVDQSWAQLRSDDSSDREVWVEFENTFPQPVNLIWVDFKGDEHSFEWLEPGQARRQKTTEHHAWLFRNRAGRMLGSYAATGVAEQRCRIGMPPPWAGPRPGAEWISERGGRFVNGAEGQWTYVAPNGIAVYEFDEEERTWEYVSLFDIARGERVRLYRDKLLVNGPGDREWVFDANGQWNAEDDPGMAPFPGGVPGSQMPPPGGAGPVPYGWPGPYSPRPSTEEPLPPGPPSAGPPADYTPPLAPGQSPVFPQAGDARPAVPGSGAVPGLPAPAPLSSPRSRWDSNEGGYYQKMGNGKWAEYASPGAAAHWFEEHEATDRYVALYDRERELWIRIYEDRVLAFPSGASNWKLRVSGGWTR